MTYRQAGLRRLAGWLGLMLAMAVSPAPLLAQDTSPPTVSVVYPLRLGELVGGVVTLSADATDNTGVAGVQFLLDGAPIGTEVTSSPWQLSWDSSAASVGPHQVKVRARDAAGNTATTSAGGWMLVYRPNDTTFPTISGVGTTALTSRSVVVQWTTDQYANSRVEYGLTSGYGTSAPANVTKVYAGSTGNHSISLTGLSPGTTYNYRVRSRNAAGRESISQNYTVTTPADPAPVSAAATGWTELPGTAMRPACSANHALYPFNSRCYQIIDAWGAGTWDTTAKRLLLFGGGHQDYFGNDVYAFRLDALGFERVQEASGGFIYPAGPCEDALPDGNPVSRHTYNHVVHLPLNNALWMYGGSRACGSGGASSDTWLFDLAGKRWERQSPTGSAPGPYILTAAYDPQTNQIYVTGPSALYTYQVSASAWVKRRDFAFSDYGRLVSTIDPVRRLLVIAGGNDTTRNIFTCELDSPYTCQRLTTTGANAIEQARSPGLAYDPVRARIVAWDVRAASTVYELDLATATWTAIPTTGGPASRTIGGTFGHWQYVPDLQGFLAVPSVDSNVYVWRFPTGAATPPPGTPTLTVAPTTAAAPPATATIAPPPPTTVAAGGTPTPPPATPTVPPTAPIPGGTPGAFSIPLTLKQLLPADDAGGIDPSDVPGVALTNEPASFGVPLADAASVTAVGQLAVTRNGTPIPAQFRILNRYASGNIQWVLVDVQADVAANGTNTALALVPGTNPAAGTLATDSGGTITVDTGAAQFTLKKANSNFIDRVVVGTTTVVPSGHTGGVEYTDSSSGTTYASRYDAGSTATLEENGPLKATVLLQGRLRDPAGTASMGYSARLHFYKNHRFVRGRVSIENAFRDDMTRKQIGGIQVRLPSAIGANATYAFATRTGTVTGTLASGETAYLYQGRTRHKDADSVNIIKATGAYTGLYNAENDYNWNYTALVKPSDDLGFTVVKGGTTAYAFSGESDYSRGFVDVSDPSGAGISAAMRDFDSFYPTGLELAQADGSVAVQWFSPHNPKTPLRFDWGVHETRDVVWDFRAAADSNAALLAHHRAQYPLFGRAPFDHYASTGALLGRTNLVSFDALRDYHANNVIGGRNQWGPTNQWQFGISDYRLPNQPIIRMRSFYWGDGGRQTNNDQTFSKLLAFLQTGQGGFWHNAYNISHFTVDQAMHRSDREDRTTWPKGLEMAMTGCGGAGVTNMVNGCASKFEEDMEHMNTLGVPVLFYLTGDEFVREGLVDMAEWLYREHPANTNPCDYVGRGDGQRLKWYSVIWEMTGDARWKSEMDRFVDKAACFVVSDPTDWYNQGQDTDRGYEWRVGGLTPGTPPIRPNSIGPTFYIPVEGEWEAARVLPATDPRKETLLDRLTGMSFFLSREAFFDRNNSDCRGFGDQTGGYNSAVNLDGAPRDDSVRTAITAYNLFPALNVGTQRFWDANILHTGRRTVGNIGSFNSPTCGSVGTGSQMYHVYNLWGPLEFVWLDTHRGSTVFLNDDPATAGGLVVNEEPPGTYTIEWTVPANTKSYQVKYGPQPMVPNLNFDRTARTYQYDPALYDNFWATNGGAVGNQPVNVPDEPVPGPSGSTQTYVRSGLPSGLRWALRVDTTSTVPSGNPPSAPRLL